MSSRFAKMHGAANDFIVMAGVPPSPPGDATMVRDLCDRRRGIGADGVLWMQRLGEDSGYAFRMHFYNADGGRANLCLNGSRCCALRAVQLGWSHPGKRFRFRTEQAELEVEVERAAPHSSVALWIDAPNASIDPIQLPPDAPARMGHPVDTGDPHLVVEVARDVLDNLQIDQVGPALRHWKGFFPEGSNVHFVSRGPREWAIRSFERGVEAETWACGSGCLSAVAALAHTGLRREIELRTRSGDTVGILPSEGRWRVRGPAVLVFEGVYESS